MTNQIVHKKIIDDQCIFDVYFYMLTHSSSALFVKGATARSFSSSAFPYSALLLSHYISHPISSIRSTHSHTLTGSLSIPRAGPPPSPLLPLRRRHLLLLAGLGTGLLLRPPSPLAAGRPLLAPPSSSVLPPLAAGRPLLAPPSSSVLLSSPSSSRPSFSLLPATF